MTFQETRDQAVALIQPRNDTLGPLALGASVSPSVKWAGLTGDAEALLGARVMLVCGALAGRCEGWDGGLGGHGRGCRGRRLSQKPSPCWEQGNRPAYSAR